MKGRGSVFLAGRAGAGKDWLAAELVARGWRKLSIARPLKDGVAAALGMSVAEVDAIKDGVEGADMAAKMRACLQRFGTENLRDIWGDDVLLDSLQRRTDWGRGPFVVTDGRFVNEVEWFREQGFLVVYVDAPKEFLRQVPAHATEAMTSETCDWDRLIWNDRTKSAEMLLTEAGIF